MFKKILLGIVSLPLLIMCLMVQIAWLPLFVCVVLPIYLFMQLIFILKEENGYFWSGIRYFSLIFIWIYLDFIWDIDMT